MINISLYKKINDSMVESLVKSISFNYSYFQNGIEKTLNVQDYNDKSFTLTSEDDNWSCESFGLSINCNLNLKSIKSLFSVNGIAYSDSILGVSLHIFAPKSKYRKIVKLGTLSESDENANLNSTLIVEPNKIDSNINCKIVCYLEKSSKQNTLFFKNNNQGIILGDLYNQQIILEGSSSIFPIINIHAPGKPLWSFMFDTEDPDADLFIDSAKIILNTANNDYKLVDAVASKSYCDRIVIEIFKSSMAEFFTILKEKDLLPDISTSYEPGTVSSFAHYLITKHNIKVDSASNIYESLNNFFENGGE